MSAKISIAQSPTQIKSAGEKFTISQQIAAASSNIFLPGHVFFAGTSPAAAGKIGSAGFCTNGGGQKPGNPKGLPIFALAASDACERSGNCSIFK